MPRERCILIFLKSPDPGLTKSRLSRDVDKEVVLSLYRNFCLDLLETLGKGRQTFTIFFYPPESGEKISDWLGKDFVYKPQQGNDLGERMKNAFTLTFSEGFSKVLLIGSDVPDITNEVLEEAFEFNGSEAVVGPAFDGGYYLIGFKNDTFLPEIFEEIPWSTDAVFEKTMEIFKKNHYGVHLLPKWGDVDRIEDLRDLVERNRHTEFLNSRTMAFISNNKKRFFKANKSD